MFLCIDLLGLNPVLQIASTCFSDLCISQKLVIGSAGLIRFRFLCVDNTPSYVVLCTWCHQEAREAWFSFRVS
jgi:hypothetical protein